MKFKIVAKTIIKNLEIGDVVQIGKMCYVVTDFREQSIGMRVWGKSVNGDKLTHLFGLENYRQLVKEGRIKLVQYVQNQG